MLLQNKFFRQVVSFKINLWVYCSSMGVTGFIHILQGLHAACLQDLQNQDFVLGLPQHFFMRENL